MSEIDWSKAPEGATHWERESYGASAGWMKKDGGEWFFLSSEGCWLKHIISNVSAERLQNMVPCPDSSPEWNGEGLPPVGVRCEAAIPHTSGPDNERSFIWIEGSVIAYYEIKGKTYAWFSEDDGFYPPNVLEFRPIRAPEQIAADEREKAIKAMVDVLQVSDNLSATAEYIVCGILHDAGYRKQEQPK